jgi:hypothetical protein
MEIIIFPALSIGFVPQIKNILRSKTKNPLGLRVGRIFFPLDSLTETPPATRLDAK